MYDIGELSVAVVSLHESCSARSVCAILRNARAHGAARCMASDRSCLVPRQLHAMCGGVTAAWICAVLCVFLFFCIAVRSRAQCPPGPWQPAGLLTPLRLPTCSDGVMYDIEYEYCTSATPPMYRIGSVHIIGADEKQMECWRNAPPADIFEAAASEILDLFCKGVCGAATVGRKFQVVVMTPACAHWANEIGMPSEKMIRNCDGTVCSYM